jgi:hypothetical protein
MNVVEIIESLRKLSNPERLEIIEAAARLVREDLAKSAEHLE